MNWSFVGTGTLVEILNFDWNLSILFSYNSHHNYTQSGSRSCNFGQCHYSLRMGRHKGSDTSLCLCASTGLGSRLCRCRVFLCDFDCLQCGYDSTLQPLQLVLVPARSQRPTRTTPVGAAKPRGTKKYSGLFWSFVQGYRCQTAPFNRRVAPSR